MKTLISFACVVAGAVALAGGWRSVQAAVGVASTRGELSRAWAGQAVDVPLHGVRVVRLNRPDAADSLDLGTLERAVIFVFEPSCQATDANMHNWIDLVRQVPAGAPLYALTYQRSAPEQNLAYWDGMHPRVTVLGTSTRTLVDRMGVVGTPTVLVVRGGRIRHAWSGFTLPETKQELAGILASP